MCEVSLSTRAVSFSDVPYMSTRDYEKIKSVCIYAQANLSG